MNIFTLENRFLKLNFLDIGGSIVDLIKKSNNLNYVIHYDDIEKYKSNSYFLGTTIGRNAGRTYPPYYVNYLNKKIELDKNELNKHIHGGKNGFHTKKFEVIRKNKLEYKLYLKDNNSIYDSADIEISYRLESNRFIYTIKGHSKVPTIFNVTNHTYFNLNEDKSKDIGNHFLRVDSNKIQLIDSNYIPNGEFEKLGSVKNQDFFFNTPKPIHQTLSLGTSLSNICSQGIDLAYILDEDFLNEKIHLESFDRKNQLKIYSNQNSCVIYTLNKINESVNINNGKKIKKYNGITFEMQEIPNYVHSSSNYLRDSYESITIYEII